MDCIPEERIVYKTKEKLRALLIGVLKKVSVAEVWCIWKR